MILSCEVNRLPPLMRPKLRVTSEVKEMCCSALGEMKHFPHLILCIFHALPWGNVTFSRLHLVYLMSCISCPSFRGERRIKDTKMDKKLCGCKDVDLDSAYYRGAFFA